MQYTMHRSGLQATSYSSAKAISGFLAIQDEWDEFQSISTAGNYT